MGAQVKVSLMMMMMMMMMMMLLIMMMMMKMLLMMMMKMLLMMMMKMLLMMMMIIRDFILFAFSFLKANKKTKEPTQAELSTVPIPPKPPTEMKKRGEEDEEAKYISMFFLCLLFERVE